MSRDIDARFPQRDPIIERLEASRDIAHAERDKALALVAELTDELRRARRCLSSSRCSHELAAQQWEQERADLRFRLDFAAKALARREQPSVVPVVWFKAQHAQRDANSLEASSQ